MKLSKMIEELQKIEKKYGGDIPCCVYDPEMAADGFYDNIPAYIGFGTDSTGQIPNEIIFMDYETAMAFS